MMTSTPEVHRESEHYVFKAAVHFVPSTGSKRIVCRVATVALMSTRRITPDKWHVTSGFVSCIDSVVLLTTDLLEWDGCLDCVKR